MGGRWFLATHPSTGELSYGDLSRSIFPFRTMKPTQTYPLYYLFILVTICAVLAAMLVTVIPSLLDGGWSIGYIATWIVVAGILSAILGTLVGLYHVNRARGIIYGATLGFVLGSTVSLLFFVDQRYLGQLLAAQIGGAILLVCVTACLSLGIRRNSP